MTTIGIILCAWFAAEPTIGPAERDADGVLTHRVESPRQSAPTDVRVLLPSPLDTMKKYPVVYLLPVEPGRETRYGDSLAVARDLDAANKYQVICVAPSFAALPWYADHPTDVKLAQEAYFIHDIVPFIERTYPTISARRGRRLCGFSKSGWGAWSLLLRHPDTFERAASWDAPLLMDAPGKYGSGPIFGTPENFAHYQITKLLDACANDFKNSSRLILLGYGGFTDHRPIHEQLEKLGVPHVYQDGPKTPHVWSRAWLEPALEALVK
jgi:enterochelin esterase-like enzyme